MKILISKSQLSEIILNHKNGVNEGSTSPVIIKCHDYDKIEENCSLKYSNSDLSKIYSAVSKDSLKSKYFEQFDYFLNEIKEESSKSGGLSYFNIYAKKFNNNIVASRDEIFNIIDKYSLDVLKAMLGLRPLIDTTSVLNEVGNVLYNSFYQVWSKNWAQRKMASVFVNKNNIGDILSTFKSEWDDWFWKVDGLIEVTYDVYVNYIYDYSKNLNKTTPLCTSVKIIQDQGCNNIKPINPKMIYPYATTGFINVRNPKDNIWPKVESLIRSLV
jgi:hypothetical protein